MPSSTGVSGSVRFEDFEVDLNAGQLRRRGIRIHLRAQSFDILALLLSRAGEVVTREEIQRKLWPGNINVGFAQNLNSAVARLRQALNDSAEHPRLIETLPKRGYRFVGPCPQFHTHITKAGPPKRVRLLVLPFTNLSGDPGQEFIGDAMTEDVITAIASLAPESVSVIARTTSMHYRRRDPVISQIRQELGVDFVLEGSVRSFDSRLTVTFQLIRTSDESHLLAGKREVKHAELFTLHDEIARSIIERLPLDAKEDSRSVREPTTNFHAYSLYCRGRFEMNQWTPDGIAAGRALLQEAVTLDPGFALAYDSLAELYWYMGFLGFISPREAQAEGMWAAIRAVELDPDLADTHALLGMYRKETDYDWSEVAREMALALRLSPASPVVRFRRALSYLLPLGRLDEAISEIRGALESDPLSSFIRFWLVTCLWFNGDLEEALHEARRTVELDPASHLAHFTLAVMCMERGSHAEAACGFQKAVELSGGSPLLMGWMGAAAARAGDQTHARRILESLHQISGSHYVPPSSFAWIHLALGELDTAFEWLNRAVDARDPMIVPLRLYPFLYPLHPDPRFQAILRRLRLDEASMSALD